MSKSGREYFRLGAESYSSLRRVEKKEENTRVHFGTFSPVDKFQVLACIGYGCDSCGSFVDCCHSGFCCCDIYADPIILNTHYLWLGFSRTF